MGKRETPEFFNPDLRLTEEEESERQRLVNELDEALSAELLSKKKQAQCWAALRPLYSKPGCKGKWEKFITSKGCKKSTVNGLIKRLNDGWEESVKKPKKLSPNRPNSGRFTGPGLEFTGKPFLTDEEITAGHAGKEILEAAFLFTPDEKEQFMEALQIIGPEKALDIMRASTIERTWAGHRRRIASWLSLMGSLYDRNRNPSSHHEARGPGRDRKQVSRSTAEPHFR